MKQPYIGNTKINKLYKGNELWCNWNGSGGGSEPVEPSNKPIMDGLVCWLDGRDYDNGSNTWNDRSGLGNHGTLSNTNGVSSNSGVLFNGQVLVNNVTKNLTDYTIMVHFKLITTKFWSSIFGNTSGNGGVSIFNTSANKIGLYGPSNDIAREYTPNSENIVSVIIRCTEGRWKIYTNNISSPILNRPVNLTDADYMNLCSRKVNNPPANSTDFKDSQQNEWYSFKFYNRVLTEDEIKHNLAYEEENGRNLYFDYNDVTMTDTPITDIPGEMNKGGIDSE